MLLTMLHDFRHGIRTLLRNPGLLLGVIRALSLGVCTNTAILSGINAMLLPPYPQPERVVQVLGRFSNGDGKLVRIPEFAF
jgi:hypothetical protein